MTNNGDEKYSLSPACTLLRNPPLTTLSLRFTLYIHVYSNNYLTSFVTESTN